MTHNELQTAIIVIDKATQIRCLTAEHNAGLLEYAFVPDAVNPKLHQLFEAAPILYQTLSGQNVGIAASISVLQMVMNAKMEMKRMLPEVINTLMFMQDQILMAQHLTRVGVSKSVDDIRAECKRIADIGK